MKITHVKAIPYALPLTNPLVMAGDRLREGGEVAKQAYAEGRPVIDVALELTDLSREELARLLDPAELTQGGI